MNSTTIPRTISTYKNGSRQRITVKHYDSITYKTDSGIINVLYWSRYPRYDFIFGVPDKTHKLHKEEAGYFEIRNKKRRKRAKITGFYLDRRELKEFVKGFKAMVGKGKP